jgi:hypothetical protein
MIRFFTPTFYPSKSYLERYCVYYKHPIPYLQSKIVPDYFEFYQKQDGYDKMTAAHTSHSYEGKND